MAAQTAAARQATNLLFRLSAPKAAANLVHRRGLREKHKCLIVNPLKLDLSSRHDHHGPPKVNLWQDPLSPSKWKEEHFVIASLTGWGLLIFGGYKLFSGGKKENKEEKVGEKSQ